MKMVVSEGLKDYESVRNWLGRLRPSSARTYLFQFNRFYKWMRENDVELGKLSPDELVVLQSEAINSERFRVLDVLQRYVLEAHATLNYKKKMYNGVRSFFLHNRAELPRDKSFNLRGDKPKTQGTLTAEEIKRIVLASKPVYQAVILSMFQGGMGEDEFTYWNEHGLEKLKEDLRGDPEMIRIDLPGRKGKKFEKPYYTFIGHDAIRAIRNWLKRRPDKKKTYHPNDKNKKRKNKRIIREEPTTAIFTNQYQDAISQHALQIYWTRVGRRIGVITPKTRGGGKGHQTGKNPHEFRDVFRSQWEKSPAKASVAEFCMGHVVDQLEYNKAHRDEGWVRREYEKAQPLLQIMSSTVPFNLIDADEVTKLRKKVARLESERIDVKRMVEEELAEVYAEIERLKETDKILTVVSETKHKVVESEDEMIQLLDDGWTLVQQLNGDKYLLKK